MKVHNLTIDSSKRDSTLYPDANNYVVTLENPIYDVEEIRLASGYIPTPQTPSPNSIILRLSSGSDEFNQSVYLGMPKDIDQKGTPHYTGHILLDGTTKLTFNGSDDPFIHRFHSGSQKIISELGLEFLYLDNGNLERYDFNSENHTLKFEIKCYTNKLENLTKYVQEDDQKKEPIEENTNISIPEISDIYEWKWEIVGIVLFGLIIMFFTKGKPKYPRSISE